MSYNGYTNFETWSIQVVLADDATLYDYWTREGEHQWQKYEDEQAAYELADLLKEAHEARVPHELWGTVYGSLLGAALSEVNWLEIARHWLPEEYEGWQATQAACEV